MQTNSSPVDPEILELWARARATPPDEDAVEDLIRMYMPLAERFAKRAKLRAPAHQALDELVSFAYGGLADAVRRFDPDMGVKFETYATRRIPNAIIDGQRQIDPLTRNDRRRVKSVQEASTSFWATEGREPSVAELAAALPSETEQTVQELLIIQQSMAAELEDAHATLTHHDGATVELEELATVIARRMAAAPETARAFALATYAPEPSVPNLEVTAHGRKTARRDLRAALVPTSE